MQLDARAIKKISKAVDGVFAEGQLRRSAAFNGRVPKTTERISARLGLKSSVEMAQIADEFARLAAMPRNRAPVLSTSPRTSQRSAVVTARLPIVIAGFLPYGKPSH